MNQSIADALSLCQAHLSQGYTLWNELGFTPLTQKEREEIPLLVLEGCTHPHHHNLAAACQSFALFRTLHGKTAEGDPKAILLGDYFFGIFSQCLIPLDSTWLTLEFSKFLREDTEGGVDGHQPFDRDAYKAFVLELTRQWTP